MQHIRRPRLIRARQKLFLEFRLSCSFAAISCCKDCSPAFNCDCCSAHASATCVGVYVDNACFPVSSCKLANMPSAYFFFAICACSVCFWSNVCRHLPNAFSLLIPATAHNQTPVFLPSSPRICASRLEQISHSSTACRYIHR